MALIIRPPITGDSTLDSWTNQMTQALNKGILGGGSSGTGGTLVPTATPTFNSATLFLYQRTLTSTTPATISVETTYDYETGVLTDPDGNTGSTALDDPIDSVWFRELPASTELILNEYVWVIAVNIADTDATEEIPSAIWSSVALLSKVVSDAPDPSQISGFSNTQISNDSVRFEWTFSPDDTPYSGLTAILQEFDIVDMVWTTVSIVSFPDQAVVLTGFESRIVNSDFRIIARNMVDVDGPVSLTNTWMIPTPATPTAFTVVRTGPSTAVANWSYAPTFANLALFDLQQDVIGGAFSSVNATFSADDRTILLDGLGSITSPINFRIRAMATNGTVSAFVTAATLAPVTPTVPDSLSFTRVDVNMGTLSWGYAENFAELGRFILEESIDGAAFTSLANLDNDLRSHNIFNLRFEDDTVQYRIRSRGTNGIESANSNIATFTPAAPNIPLAFAFVRLNSDLGEFTWTHAPGLTPATAFVLEISPSGENSFTVISTTDGTERSLTLNGLAVENTVFDYRLKAVSATNVSSLYSLVAEVTPPVVLAPTAFSAMPVEAGGVLTTASLLWTLADDQFNLITQVTVQFRGITTPASNWRDVATFSADVNEGDNLPLVQGNVEYRIRVTAINGLNSAFTLPSRVFIAGGSATDDAIYNGDSAFLSDRHYSVNDEDILLNAAVVRIVEGSTDDIGPYTTATSIEGINGTELTVDFLINPSQAQVDINRHFYLNLDNITTVGTMPLNWDVDTGNVFVEIISDPTETADMYSDVDTVDPDDDLVYTDAPTSTALNTRTFNERAGGGNMYATQTFVRLPLRRTFTFRESGPRRIRINFAATATAHPVISLTNPISLDAFASERLESFMATGVGPDDFDPGTPVDTTNANRLVFTESFEEVLIDGVHANPQVLTTPGNQNTNTWFTNRTNLGVDVHAGTNNTMVDVTVRGR